MYAYLKSFMKCLANNQLVLLCFYFQIEEFRRLRTHVKGAELVEGCDGILGDNFRPTQPLSDRVIRAAFQ